MKLSRSEMLWLFMKRMNVNREHMAKVCGVTVNRVSDWQNGRDTKHPAFPSFPEDLQEGQLHEHERIALFRRRRGWTIKQAASMQGISHVTLIKRESGKGNVGETLEWWMTHKSEHRR